MCGIVGIADFKSQVVSYDKSLTIAIKNLSKRGPDFQNTYIDHSVLLGHTRLAVIDTSPAANQPFTDISGQYTIVFNGEIYNFRTLRNDLEREGFMFRTKSDTEVVLYSYIKFGIHCLQLFNGDFSFAIYDKKQKQLIIARDRFGIKPLVYCRNNSTIIFSSEIKGVLPFLERKPELSYEALNLYLQLNYIPAPYTIYKDIFKLKPAHYILISENNVEINKYYTIPEENQNEIIEENAVFDSFKDIFIRSVERRLISDVPIGTFLSGGIDSSVITAVAKQFKPDINTFTVQFTENKFIDESNDAERVSKFLQTHHHTIPVSQKAMLEEVYNVLDYLDEPFADSSAIAVSVLANYTRRNITVALSGDGADELFGGYQKHKAHDWAIKNANKKQLLNTASFFTKTLPSSRKSAISNKIRQIQKLAEGINLSSKERYWLWCCFQKQKNVNSLLNNTFINASELKDALLPTEAGSFNEVLYNDMHLVLPNDMLFKADSMSMLHSLEVRVPMLDHTMVDFVAPLPSKFKINGNIQKYILKKTLGENLPQDILTKPKHGFEIPIEQWLKGELKELILLYLNKENIFKHNLFNINEINKSIARLNSFRPSDSAIHLWNLIVFQYWYINKYL
ncbi:MAG TPA: asparagine synthase (glutamine-hydrolyzing) [Bacteroidales bacterium]|nr:asparagine synthase (glutamine-hydrolyzing) [Bacteroidales bacterium]